VKHSALIRFD